MQAKSSTRFGAYEIKRDCLKPQRGSPRAPTCRLRGGIDLERAAPREARYLVLGGSRLEPRSEEGFLRLALDGALIVQEQVLGSC
jgi:hypothetical protein